MIMVEDWWRFAKKGDCVGNIYFKHRSLYKYTRVAMGRDGLEIKSMIDLVLRYVQDVEDGRCRIKYRCRGL